jgi:hypothetical protein
MEIYYCDACNIRLSVEESADVSVVRTTADKIYCQKCAPKFTTATSPKKSSPTIHPVRPSNSNAKLMAVQRSRTTTSITPVITILAACGGVAILVVLVLVFGSTKSTSQNDKTFAKASAPSMEKVPPPLQLPPPRQKDSPVHAPPVLPADSSKVPAPTPSGQSETPAEATQPTVATGTPTLEQWSLVNGVSRVEDGHLIVEAEGENCFLNSKQEYDDATLEMSFQLLTAHYLEIYVRNKARYFRMSSRQGTGFRNVTISLSGSTVTGEDNHRSLVLMGDEPKELPAKGTLSLKLAKGIKMKFRLLAIKFPPDN